MTVVGIALINISENIQSVDLTVEGTVNEEMEGKHKVPFGTNGHLLMLSLKGYFTRQKPFKSILYLKAYTEACFQQLLLKHP